MYYLPPRQGKREDCFTLHLLLTTSHWGCLLCSLAKTTLWNTCPADIQLTAKNPNRWSTRNIILLAQSPKPLSQHLLQQGAGDTNSKGGGSSRFCCAHLSHGWSTGAFQTQIQGPQKAGGGFSWGQSLEINRGMTARWTVWRDFLIWMLLKAFWGLWKWKYNGILLKDGEWQDWHCALILNTYMPRYCDRSCCHCHHPSGGSQEIQMWETVDVSFLSSLPSCDLKRKKNQKERKKNVL